MEGHSRMSTIELAQAALYILSPVLLALVTAVAGIVAPKITSIVGAKNDQLLRDALHKSVMNGLQFAATKAGTNASLVELTRIATAYVKEMSPEVVKKIGVTDEGIAAIVASKVQEKPDINPPTVPTRNGP